MLSSAREYRLSSMVYLANSSASFADRLTYQMGTEFLKLLTGCIVAKSKMESSSMAER